MRRGAGRNRLVGIFVTQLVEREGAAVGHFEGALDGFLVAFEKPGQLAGRFEVAFGVAVETVACLMDRAFFADAGEHVLKGPASGVVVQHIVGGEKRSPVGAGESGKTVEAGAVLAVAKHGGGKIEGRGDMRAQRCERIREGAAGHSRRRHGREDHAVLMFGDIGKAEIAATLPGAALAVPSATGITVRRRSDRADRRAATCRMQDRSSTPTMTLNPRSLPAWWARTTPASVLRSVMAMAARPSCFAWATSSSACDPPRRKEKLVVTCSSA